MVRLISRYPRQQQCRSLTASADDAVAERVPVFGMRGCCCGRTTDVPAHRPSPNVPRRRQLPLSKGQEEAVPRPASGAGAADAAASQVPLASRVGLQGTLHHQLEGARSVHPYSRRAVPSLPLASHRPARPARRGNALRLPLTLPPPASAHRVALAGRSDWRWGLLLVSSPCQSFLALSVVLALHGRQAGVCARYLQIITPNPASMRCK